MNNAFPLLFSIIFLQPTPSLRAQEPRVLEDYKNPFHFSYMGFDRRTGHSDGAVTIDAPDGKGGAGTNLASDLSKIADWSPALRLRTDSGNKAKSIVLFLKDAGKGEAKFHFDLEPGNGEFQILLPRDSAPLDSGTLDLGQVTQFQIQGTWTPDAVKVGIDQILAVPPTEEMKAARSATADKRVHSERQKAEQAAREITRIENLLAQPAAHPADGAEIMHIGAASPNIIGLELRDRKVKRLLPEPYVAMEGDVIEARGNEKLAWEILHLVKQPSSA